jgi:hypothetical protein
MKKTSTVANEFEVDEIDCIVQVTCLVEGGIDSAGVEHGPDVTVINAEITRVQSGYDLDESSPKVGDDARKWLSDAEILAEVAHEAVYG